VMYCAEWPDNDGQVLNLVFDPEAEMTEQFVSDRLNGMEIIKTVARPAARAEGSEIILGDETEVTLIPYHLWNNRGAGQMMVWLPVAPEAARATPAPTIAYRSRVSASKDTRALLSVNDQYEPASSIDRNWGYYHWWPETQNWVWVQYDFEKPEIISSSKVYWFDDGPDGGCRIPEAWEILYMKDGKWIPVETTGDYTITKDNWDKIEFSPVETGKVRLRVKLGEYSSGVHEWVIN